jgi:hypothetical protein
MECHQQNPCPESTTTGRRQEVTSRPGRRPAECAIVVGASVQFMSALTADYQSSQFQEAVLRPGQGERDEAA